MNITKAEKAWLKRERYRIALDARDWNTEPHVTQVQLREMSPHMRDWFSPKIWRPDYQGDILRNTAHPANADWANRELLLEVVACTSGAR